MLSRDDVIGLLDTVMVAPVTSAVCGAPSEVVVGVDEGLKQGSALHLDHVQTVEMKRLKMYVGVLSRDKLVEVCEALAIATACR